MTNLGYFGVPNFTTGPCCHWAGCFCWKTETMGSHSQEGLLDKIVQHWLPILALTPQARTEWLPSLLSRAPITSNWKQIHILAPVFWASTNIERLGSILGFPTLATFLEMPWPLAANRRPIPADQTLAGQKKSPPDSVRNEAMPGNPRNVAVVSCSCGPSKTLAFPFDHVNP
jgi:hypothetical protein